jgi:ectoine hydroxylase-related dioxygenase (phytanoyl-CoA dioxygenase family)
MSVDFRTRRDDDPQTVTATEFFDEYLPTRFVTETDIVASTERLDLRPVAVCVEDRTWIVWRETGLQVAPASATTPDPVETWHLTEANLADVVTDQVTPVGLMTSNALVLDRQRIARVMDWWLVWRAILDGRTIYAPGEITVDADLTRSFTLRDPVADMRAFLETNGYLHLREVFDPAAMERISADMDTVAPTHTPDDGNSWWATLADGSRRVVRMQRFDDRSPTTADLIAGTTYESLASIPGCGHSSAWRSPNHVEALFKPIGVTEGISDIPWHKDCSLGRHSYQCCGLTVGISVTGAGPTSGQLRVIAGSHRALVWPSLFDPATLDLPDVPLATETGDVTLHLSCTMHRAQPPTERERRVLYTGFALPPADPVAAAFANRRLLDTAREQAPLTTSQSATRR